VLVGLLLILTTAVGCAARYSVETADNFVPKPKPLDCVSFELVAASERPADFDEAAFSRAFEQVGVLSSDEPVSNRDDFLRLVRTHVCSLGGDVVVMDVRDARGAPMRPVKSTGDTGGKIAGGIIYRHR